MRIVAMWSGSVRDGFCLYVSILGVMCTVAVVATGNSPPPPKPSMVVVFMSLHMQVPSKRYDNAVV